MSSVLFAQTVQSTAFLTLNRPAALNALTLDMIRGLTQALCSWETDSNIHGVVIRGRSPKAFCAGGDIRFFYDAILAGDNASVENFFTEEYTLNHRIHCYPKPYITLLDGIVMGGGMGIAQSSAASRIRIVTERTRMAMPEVNIGLFPDVGGGHFLSRLSGEIGTFLGLTGETIDAADALFAGLADAFVPSVELPALCSALASVTDGDYCSLVAQFAAPFKDQVDIAGSTLARHQPLIDRHFSQDSVPDILTSLLRDTHPFAQKIVATMMQRSPLMLCVALEQMRRARTMTLADCLRMERTMMRRSFEHGDAMEGIRAAIIDKDNKPQWRPASLDGVSAEMIARFFSPAWADDAHPLRGLA